MVVVGVVAVLVQMVMAVSKSSATHKNLQGHGASLVLIVIVGARGQR